MISLFRNQTKLEAIRHRCDPGRMSDVVGDPKNTRLHIQRLKTNRWCQLCQCATPVTMENGIIWWQNWELLHVVVVMDSKTAVVWFWHLIVAPSRACLAVRLERVRKGTESGLVAPGIWIHWPSPVHRHHLGHCVAEYGQPNGLKRNTITRLFYVLSFLPSSPLPPPSSPPSSPLVPLVPPHPLPLPLPSSSSLRSSSSSGSGSPSPSASFHGDPIHSAWVIINTNVVREFGLFEPWKSKLTDTPLSLSSSFFSCSTSFTSTSAAGFPRGDSFNSAWILINKGR